MGLSGVSFTIEKKFWPFQIIALSIFSRESDSTITNVRPSVSHKAKPPNSLKSLSFILHPSSFILHPSSFSLQPSSFILHPSSFILHPSSFIIHPSSFFPHFATFKLFSLFLLKSSLRESANCQGLWCLYCLWVGIRSIPTASTIWSKIFLHNWKTNIKSKTQLEKIGSVSYLKRSSQ